MVKFREYVTHSGLLVFGGKNAENNDELVSAADPKDTLLHTEAPGSPFVNAGKTPSKKDIGEAAVFCAKYSQEWKKTKSNITVGIFKRSDMNKETSMKSGTWSVKKQKRIKIKKENIFKFEEELSTADLKK
jgi:predicted ribosome quality control (RQC) complex YloA/Tae2 family protein